MVPGPEEHSPSAHRVLLVWLWYYMGIITTLLLISIWYRYCYFQHIIIGIVRSLFPHGNTSIARLSDAFTRLSTDNCCGTVRGSLSASSLVLFTLRVARACSVIVRWNEGWSKGNGTPFEFAMQVRIPSVTSGTACAWRRKARRTPHAPGLVREPGRKDNPEVHMSFSIIENFLSWLCF